MGFIDGIWVGFREGTSVGCTVGTIEGEEVGLAVGLSHTLTWLSIWVYKIRFLEEQKLVYLLE